MDNLRLRDPREVPLYVFSVLVNLSIVALILVGALLPRGEEGLVLLAAGRYVYKEVNVEEFLEQARRFRGFWPAVAQLPQSHPFTLRRLRALYDAGFFGTAEENPAAGGVVATET